jgi:hypothetical protein
MLEALNGKRRKDTRHDHNFVNKLGKSVTNYARQV